MYTDTIEWDSFNPETDLEFKPRERNKYGSYGVTLRANKEGTSKSKILRFNTVALKIPFGIEFYRDQSSGKVLDAYIQGSFEGLEYSPKWENYIPAGLEVDESKADKEGGILTYEDLQFIVKDGDKDQARKLRVWEFYRFICRTRDAILKKAVEMIPDDTWDQSMKAGGWFRYKTGEKLSKEDFVYSKFHSTISYDENKRYPPMIKLKLNIDEEGTVTTPIFNTKGKAISTAEVPNFSQCIAKITWQSIWINATQFGCTNRVSQIMVKPPKEFVKPTKADFQNMSCAIVADFGADAEDEADSDTVATVPLSQRTEIVDPVDQSHSQSAGETDDQVSAP